MLDTFYGAQLAACHLARPLSEGERPDAYCFRARLLEDLYRREYDTVIAFLSPIVGRDHAHDLAQEVFVRAATSPELVRLRNPPGFLLRIARNLSIDDARRRQRRIRTVPLSQDQDAPVDPDQAHAMEAEELEARLASALKDLPPKTAKIFSMNRFERKSYRQIHLELEIALPTVDYHMIKALSHLRKAVVEDVSAREWGSANPDKNNFM